MKPRYVLEPALYGKHVIRDTHTNIVVGFFGHLGNAREFLGERNKQPKRTIPVLQAQMKEKEDLDMILANFSM